MGVRKWLCRIVTVYEMLFSFMFVKEIIDAVLVLRRLHESHAIGKVVYVFCGLRENFFQSTNVRVRKGDEEVINTQSLGQISDV